MRPLLISHPLRNWFGLSCQQSVRRYAQTLFEFLTAGIVLFALTYALPNPLAEQGQAIFPGRTTVPPDMLMYAYMGSTLAIMAMSLILWCWFRQGLYLLCAALLAAGFCYAAFRYRPLGLWLPGAHDPQYTLAIAYCFFCVVATCFFSQLFEFRKNSAWSASIFRMVAWFNVIALLVAMVGGYVVISRAVVFMALASTVFGTGFVTYLLFICRKWTYLPGALAYALPAGLGLVNLAVTHGVYAGTPWSATPYLWLAGRISEIILLGVAVTNRSRAAERALYDERALALTRAHGAERELEIKVAQRTHDLLCAQRALEDALDSERAMRDEQRHFFNMINHEFRTPLTVVDSAATELQTFPATEPQEIKTQADQIRRASRRMMTLVDTCLINDRIDTGAFRLQMEKTAIEELFAESIELIQWSGRHQLKMDFSQACAQWQCDPLLIRIALSNLASNAIKYAKSGTITLSACTDAEGALLIRVSDEGPGLPAEAARQIFELYDRGNGARDASGHGFGLWVTKRIATLHGGDVTLEPRSQRGACFVLRLPAIAH